MVKLLVPCNGCFLKGASWPIVYHSLITELCHASHMGRPLFPLSPLLLLCSTVSSTAISPWLLSVLLVCPGLSWNRTGWTTCLFCNSKVLRPIVVHKFSYFIQLLCSRSLQFTVLAFCGCRILFFSVFDSFSVTGVLNVLQTVEFLLLLKLNSTDSACFVKSSGWCKSPALLPSNNFSCLDLFSGMGCYYGQRTAAALKHMSWAWCCSLRCGADYCCHPIRSWVNCRIFKSSLPLLLLNSAASELSIHPSIHFLLFIPGQVPLAAGLAGCSSHLWTRPQDTWTP